MANFTLEDFDRYIDYAESGTAAASLGLTGATLVAPNPVTAALAIGTNIASAGIDLYQGIRSAINGEWGDTARNAGELILSLAGAKSINSANKLYKADKALNAANAPRQYVTKTVGRGKGRHKYTTTLEHSKANELSGVGFGLSTGGNVSSFANGLTYRPSITYTVPQNNVKFIKPLNVDIKKPNKQSVAVQDNTRIVKPIIVKNKKK